MGLGIWPGHKYHLEVVAGTRISHERGKQKDTKKKYICPSEPSESNPKQRLNGDLWEELE